MLAVAATCLVAALVGAPTASAAAGHTKAHAAVSKKKLAKDIKSTRRIAVKNRANIKKANAAIAKAITDLTNAFKGGDSAIDGKINGIVAAVTPVLTQLGDGLKLVGGKLQELADGTVAGFAKVQAGFDEVEAALTKLGDFVTADEYGVLQVALDDDKLNGVDPDEGLDLIPGCFYESADIPDNAQGLILSGQCHVPASATPPSTIHFLTAIRSNENDGQETEGADVGEAGIVWYEQRNGAGDLQGGGATAPAGAGQPPAVGIPLASEMTPEDLPFPFSLVPTDHPVDLSANQFQGTPGTPTLTAAGNVISFTLRFTDLSATADDPNA